MEGQQRYRGLRAVQRMVEHAPASGGLALWAHHRDLVEGTPELAPVSTDGHTLFYAPGFDDLPLPQQAGAVAHAVLHVALRHPARLRALRARTGDVDERLFNLCADAIVNSALAHLRWLALPPASLRLQDVLASVLGLEQADEVALLQWDVERLYREIDDRQPAGRGDERQADAQARDRTSEGHDGGRPDARRDGPRAAHLRAMGNRTPQDLRSAAPGEPGHAQPEHDAEQTREWGERLQRAHASDGPASLLRALLADLPRVRTPWEQVLRTRVARALARKPGVSWSRPARSWLANRGRAGTHGRLPWEPGTTASRAAPRLVVVVDVSGSVDAPLLERFARELQALSRRLEAAMVLVAGDCEVRRVERFEPGRAQLQGLKVHGGGGTDFTPLLQEASRHRPDLVVVLTDLQGPVAHQPACPVLWAVPEAFAHAQAPFGRVLVLQ